MQKSHNLSSYVDLEWNDTSVIACMQRELIKLQTNNEYLMREVLSHRDEINSLKLQLSQLFNSDVPKPINSPKPISPKLVILPKPVIPSSTLASPITATLFFDGASKGNPGPAGYGYQIISPILKQDLVDSKFLGTTTNNVAEYHGIIAGLTRIKSLIQEHNLSHLQLLIKGDSQLVINQLKQLWEVKSPSIRDLYQSAVSLLHDLSMDGHQVTLQHIKREENRVADHLASTAATQQ